LVGVAQRDANAARLGLPSEREEDLEPVRAWSAAATSRRAKLEQAA